MIELDGNEVRKTVTIVGPFDTYLAIINSCYIHFWSLKKEKIMLKIKCHDNPIDKMCVVSEDETKYIENLGCFFFTSSNEGLIKQWKINELEDKLIVKFHEVYHFLYPLFDFI